MSHDETLREAANLLRKGLPLSGFVASLDDDTKKALSTALLADLYPTFYDDWHWLHAHPMFAQKGAAIDRLAEQFGELVARSSAFFEAFDIDVAKIDPTTERIEDMDVEVMDQKGKKRIVKRPDPARNTLVEFWLECGPIEDVRQSNPEGVAHGHYDQHSIDYGTSSHDVNLDCGGTSFQEAIVKLAKLVKKQYGEYTEDQAIGY